MTVRETTKADVKEMITTGHARNLRRTLVGFGVLGAIAMPSTALAQSSTQDGYGGVGPSVQSNIEPTASAVDNTTTAPASAGTPVAANSSNPVVDSLPFTGADLLNLLGGGALLITLGFGLRMLVTKDRRIDPAAR
jgi:hypothetical protein